MKPITNYALSEEYRAGQESLQKYYVPEKMIKCETHEWQDAKGVLYTLEVQTFHSERGRMGVSRGIVRKEGRDIARVDRNHDYFWYRFFNHSNGSSYLVCGEDYQGLTVIDMTQESRADFVDETASRGFGFCIVDAAFDSEYAPVLSVMGCIWSGPFERISYDISSPMNLPWPEIGRRDTNTEDPEENSDSE